MGLAFLSIQSDNFNLPIGIFRPFTLNVMIDMVEFKPTVLVFVSNLFHLFFALPVLFFCLLLG